MKVSLKNTMTLHFLFMLYKGNFLECIPSYQNMLRIVFVTKFKVMRIAMGQHNFAKFGHIYIVTSTSKIGITNEISPHIQFPLKCDCLYSFCISSFTTILGVFFDLRLNKVLSKQSWSWWFQTPSCSSWFHSNVKCLERRQSNAISKYLWTTLFCLI